MSEYFDGVFGVVLLVFGAAWALLMIALPFLIYGIAQNVRRAADSLKKLEEETARQGELIYGLAQNARRTAEQVDLLNTSAVTMSEQIYTLHAAISEEPGEEG